MNAHYDPRKHAPIDLLPDFDFAAETERGTAEPWWAIALVLAIIVGMALTGWWAKS